jgi:hypothetical protein
MADRFVEAHGFLAGSGTRGPSFHSQLSLASLNEKKQLGPFSSGVQRRR